MAENAEKKVVIALSDFLKEKNISDTKYAICVKYGLQHATVANWEKKAPDVVEVLFKIVQENPKTNILKALKEWQKPPYALVLIRDLMIDYKCEFLDLVKEV